MRHHSSRAARAIARAALLVCGTTGLAPFASADHTVATWNANAIGSWTTAGNWSSNPTFPNNSGTNTFDALIDTSGAQVTLNAPITINRLTLSDGTLQGSSSLRALTAASWSGGTIAGTGALNLNGTLLIGGSDHGFSGVTINTGSLSTTNWTSGNIFAVDVEGGTLNNAGTFNDSSNGGWSWFVTQTPVFNNLAGSRFVRTGATGVLQEIQAVFNNAGTLDLQSSDLFLDGGGTSSGTFLVASGSNLIFSDFNESFSAAGSPVTTLQAGSVVRSLGGVWFNQFSTVDPSYDMSTTSISGKYDSAFTVVDAGAEGSVTFKPGAIVSMDGSIGLTDWYLYSGKLSFNTGQSPNISLNNATLNGGELSGSDLIAIWGSLHWSGGTLSGPSSNAVHTEGAVTLDGVDKFILDRSFVSQGATTTAWSAGDLHLNNSSVYNDVNSTWNTTFDGTVVNDAPANASHFYNLGTFIKSSGIGASSFVNVEFNNYGTVIVQTGRLRLAGGGYHAGTFDISASGVLELSATPGGNVTDQTLGVGSVVKGPAGSQLQFVETTAYSSGSISVDVLCVEDASLYLYTASSSNTGVIASALGSYGNVVVQAGGTWSNAGSVQVGASGDGGLYVENGVVNANVIDMGILDATSSGYMLVRGASARIHNSGLLRVGNLGTAQMDITHGAQVSNTSALIAAKPGSAGTVTVDGAGSKWTSTLQLTIGGDATAAGGAGTLIIAAGGAVTAPTSTTVWNNGTILYQSGTFSTGTFTLTGGGKAILSPGNDKVVQTTAIDVDAPGGSKLDLADNKAIVDYTSPMPSPADSIRQQIRSAYNNGAWTGNGITTSTGDATHGLGYADNSVLGLSSFGGVTVDTTSVLIKFTYLGDANLDGQVNINDLYSLASNYNTAGELWTTGDFNYDGNVNVQDLTLLAINWQAGVGAPLARPLGSVIAALGLPGVATPEPTMLLTAVVLGALTRRRRRVARAH